MIIKEYRCLAHQHEFESSEESPECPFGCRGRFVVREFRTAPSIRHTGTTSHDLLAKQLASDFGMSDMRNDKDGSSVMSSTSVASGGAKNYAPHQRAKWEPSLFSPAQGWAVRKEPDPVYNHSLPGSKTSLETLIKSQPRNNLRSKTVFQKPK